MYLLPDESIWILHSYIFSEGQGQHAKHLNHNNHSVIAILTCQVRDTYAKLYILIISFSIFSLFYLINCLDNIYIKIKNVDWL